MVPMPARHARPALPALALLIALALPAHAIAAVGTAGRSFSSRMKELERRMLWEGVRQRREGIATTGRAPVRSKSGHARQLKSRLRLERSAERPREVLAPLGAPGVR